MAEVIIMKDANEAGRAAAEVILQRLAASTARVLGVATGSTPETTYRALAHARADLGGVRAFALDEYVGLPVGHPERYRAVLERELVEPLGLDPRLLFVPDTDPAGLDDAGSRYESAIAAAGGVDVQILGIGTDGHVGFNEPGSSLASRTRMKTLTAATRRDNARFFSTPEDVPLHCMTQGLGTILDARHLVLLAFGTGKAAAVAAAVEGPVTARVPASVIQLHPHVTIFLDEEAATLLEDSDYYRLVHAAKPGPEVGRRLNIG